MAITKVTSGLISADASSIDLNIDAGTLYLDVSENRVGIGTTSPTVALEVGDGTATANWLRLNGTTSDLYIGQNTGFSHFGQTNATKILSVSNHPLAYGTANAYPLIFGTFDTERMRIDSSGLVGIGCTPTDFATEIQATSSGNALKLRGRSAAENAGWLVWTDNADNVEAGMYATADNLIFANTTSYTERMRIDSSGNVGIGESSPDKILHLKSSGATGIAIESTTNAQNLDIDFYNNAGSAQARIRYAEGAGAFGFAPNVSASDALYIEYGGNVGIGTSNPLNTAHIYGTGQTTANLADSGNQGGMLRITDANTAAGAGGAILFANYYADDEPSMGFAAIKGVLNNGSTYTQGSLAFITRNAINSTSMTERMRLKYNGNFGIGDTDPDAKLTVVASSVSGGVVQIKDTDSTTSLSNTVLGLYFTNDDDCTNATYIGMYDSGSRIGSITVASATSVSYNTTSDYRLKENITYEFNALDRVAQLKPARFNWISDETNTLVDGFLAHEVQDIVPEAIHGEKDAVMEEEYEITPAVLDDDGFVVTEAEMGTREVPDYQGIDQSKLVPLLTKAIQELSDKVDNQQTIIDNLTTRIETLENA